MSSLHSTPSLTSFDHALPSPSPSVGTLSVHSSASSSRISLGAADDGMVFSYRNNQCILKDVAENATITIKDMAKEQRESTEYVPPIKSIPRSMTKHRLQFYTSSRRLWEHHRDRIQHFGSRDEDISCVFPFRKQYLYPEAAPYRNPGAAPQISEGLFGCISIYRPVSSPARRTFGVCGPDHQGC